MRTYVYSLLLWIISCLSVRVLHAHIHFSDDNEKWLYFLFHDPLDSGVSCVNYQTDSLGSGGPMTISRLEGIRAEKCQTDKSFLSLLLFQSPTTITETYYKFIVSTSTNASVVGQIRFYSTRTKCLSEEWQSDSDHSIIIYQSFSGNIIVPYSYVRPGGVLEVNGCIDRPIGSTTGMSDGSGTNSGSDSGYGSGSDSDSPLVASSISLKYYEGSIMSVPGISFSVIVTLREKYYDKDEVTDCFSDIPKHIRITSSGTCLESVDEITSTSYYCDSDSMLFQRFNESSSCNMPIISDYKSVPFTPKQTCLQYVYNYTTPDVKTYGWEGDGEDEVSTISCDGIPPDTSGGGGENNYGPTYEPVAVPTMAPSIRTTSLLQVNVSFLLTEILDVPGIDLLLNNDFKQLLTNLVCGALIDPYLTFDYTTATCITTCVDDTDCLEIGSYDPNVEIFKPLKQQSNRELQDEQYSPVIVGESGDDHVNYQLATIDDMLVLFVKMNVTLNAADFIDAISNNTINTTLAIDTSILQYYNVINNRIIHIIDSYIWLYMSYSKIIFNYNNYFNNGGVDITIIHPLVSLLNVIDPPNSNGNGGGGGTIPKWDDDLPPYPTVLPTTGGETKTSGTDHSPSNSISREATIWLSVSVVILLLLPVVTSVICSWKGHQIGVDHDGTPVDLSEGSRHTVPHIARYVMLRALTFITSRYRDAQQRAIYIVPTITSISSNVTIPMYSINVTSVNMMPDDDDPVTMAPQTMVDPRTVVPFEGEDGEP